MIKRGQKGDATVLRPTIMFCVPLILDRIYKVQASRQIQYFAFSAYYVNYLQGFKILGPNRDMRNGRPAGVKLIASLTEWQIVRK